MGLDTVEFVIWTELEFEIQIPDDDAESVRTVGEFVTLIQRLLIGKGGIDLVSKEFVFCKIRDRLVSEYGVTENLITDHAEFVRDLGLD